MTVSEEEAADARRLRIGADGALTDVPAEPIAADLRHLVGPETVVVTMQNGIPWWYFHRHGGADGLDAGAN